MKKSTHKDAILNAAVGLAKERPYYQLTQSDVCKAAACSKGLVTYHFESMGELYNAIVEYARRNEILRILGDAIAQRHPIVQQIPQSIRVAAIRELTN